MLNLDLTQYNPVQSDSQYANVPLPSAHLVVIEESEMKESMKDGYSRGTNLLLEMTILASSTGNEFVGEKLPLYIPFSGFEPNAIQAGMKRLSTLAYTLQLGSFLQNKEDLHGINFIVVLEKDAKSNFPRFKRILTAQGQEIADASGNFKPCELKDVALATELEKLLAIIQQGGQQQQQTAPQTTQFTGGNVTAGNVSAQQQNFVPQTNFAGQQQATAQQQQAQQQPAFGQQPTQQQTAQVSQGFGGAVPNVPQWGQVVNPNNGQQ